MTTNNCLDFPKWEKCTCCPNGFVGYAESDGVFSYCIGTLSMLSF